jgi:8-oxo-dGTP diphosphatase
MFNDPDERWTRLDPVDALHVAVSLTILVNNGNQLQVLMQETHEGPYSGHFVLPHQVLTDELTIEETAEALCATFEVAGTRLEQIASFSCARIDPRSRVMTVGFVGAVPRAHLEWLEGSNDVALVDIEMEPGIAMLSLGGLPLSTGFLHAEVVAEAVEQLRKAADFSLLPFALCPEAFTFAELHAAHEAISGEEITPQWLRRKLTKRVFEGDQMIVGTKVLRRDGPCKPAELYELIYVDPAARRAAQDRAWRRKQMELRGFGGLGSNRGA